MAHVLHYPASSIGPESGYFSWIKIKAPRIHMPKTWQIQSPVTNDISSSKLSRRLHKRSAMAKSCRPSRYMTVLPVSIMENWPGSPLIPEKPIWWIRQKSGVRSSISPRSARPYWRVNQPSVQFGWSQAISGIWKWYARAAKDAWRAFQPYQPGSFDGHGSIVWNHRERGGFPILVRNSTARLSTLQYEDFVRTQRLLLILALALWTYEAYD